MDKIVKVILLVHFSFPAFSGDGDIVKAKTTDATVYAQGAQLFQKASYSISAGTSEIIIEGISPRIDQNSIQVKATGSVVILDTKYTIYYPEPKEVSLEGLPLKIRNDINLLEDSLDKIGYEILEYQSEIDVLNATKLIITNNGMFKGIGKVGDSINLFKETVDYYMLKMVEINKSISSLTQKKAAKVEKQSAMQLRLQKLKQYQGNEGDVIDMAPIHRIVVTLTSKEAVSGKLNISYLVSSCGWTPLYDLRSDGLTSKINLTYKAKIFQNSGLDWEDVNLSISTNDPYQNKTKPDLHPWYIDYYVYRNDYYNYNAPAQVKDVEVLGYTNTLNNTRAMDEDMEETKALYSSDFTQVIRQLVSVEFKIDLPYSIKSDGQEHMVLIKVADLSADYTYYSIPKLDNGVYLVAQLSKLDELGLVPAQANIFFDGTYIGGTYIDPTTLEDTLNLSLGKDPNIMVKRNLLKEESKEKTLGDKKEKTMSYAIEVKNQKATEIDIIVLDQLPITQNGDIEIEKLDIGKGTLDESTGIIQWKFGLKTKESKKLNFSYKVKYNKDYTITLE
jgi:uncharacterized protein (TIGR02231 family)